jgi:rod shape-determining protein MreC
VNSRAALILLSVLLILIVTCFLLPEQIAQSLRKETSEVLGPVIRLADAPVSFFGRLNNKLKTLDQAQAELTRMRQQVAELTLQNQLLTDKSAENARLREMLGFRDASPYRLRPCRVIGREPSSWWDSVQVNVGWQDDPDLTKDQPVVSPRGVVGKTGTVSRYVTEVILLVNENCSISATTQGLGDPTSQDQGIVEGQGNFEEGKPRVLMTYLPKDSKIQVGQFVVTSGLGLEFPAGLKLGTVVEVPPLKKQYPTFGDYRVAYIEPTADLNKLDELFIVLGPKKDKDSTQPENSSPSTGAAPSSNSTSNSGT